MRIPKEPKKLKTLSLLGGSVLMLSSICQNTQAAALYNFTYSVFSIKELLDNLHERARNSVNLKR